MEITLTTHIRLKILESVALPNKNITYDIIDVGARLKVIKA
jgi:hypothetical protein